MNRLESPVFACGLALPPATACLHESAKSMLSRTNALRGPELDASLVAPATRQLHACTRARAGTHARRVRAGADAHSHAQPCGRPSRMRLIWFRARARAHALSRTPRHRTTPRKQKPSHTHTRTHAHMGIRVRTCGVPRLNKRIAAQLPDGTQLGKNILPRGMPETRARAQCLGKG